MPGSNKTFSLPTSKYSKQDNPEVSYSYNQKSYAGGFRNDCTGFVSDTLRTNGFAVPKDFSTTNVKTWARESNSYFDTVADGKTIKGQSLKVEDFKSGDVLMLGSGHAGVIFKDDNGVLRIADWGEKADGL